MTVSSACLTGSYKPLETATDAPTTTNPGTTGGTTAPTSGTTADSDTESTLTTGGTVCGDGIVDGGEECDDGNKTPGDGCENDCMLTPPNCGDGKVDLGEECDDANTDNTDDCVACKAATCGDGVVWAGQEVCDAGPDNGMYNGPCAADCQGPGPFCGDMVTNGPEQCDDGQVEPQDDGQDECSNDCLTSRYVFVTDPMHDGQFPGGIASADEICAALGEEKVKSGATWKAWLSDNTMWPAKRMDTTFKGYYRRPDGIPVAKGWADLVDGSSLLNPINVTADKTPAISTLRAWTGTDAVGMTSPPNCNNWTDNNEQAMGRVGIIDSVTSQWTYYNLQACNALFRLYCFED